MDRRREPRSAFNQPVWITALADIEAGFAGTGVDLSGSGMRLTTDRELLPDTPVKVETTDALYLAEVCYCIRHKGEFVIGLAVDQVLRGLPDLAKLRRRLTEDAARPVPIPDAQPVHTWSSRLKRLHGH